jgi:hypothetical protein
MKTPLTKYEKEMAARELCTLYGVDPDARVAHSAQPDNSGFTPDVLLYTSAWQLRLADIEHHENVQAAIDYAVPNRENRG